MEMGLLFSIKQSEKNSLARWHLSSMGPVYTPPVSSSASCSSSAATAGDGPRGSPQPMVSQPQA